MLLVTSRVLLDFVVRPDSSRPLIMSTGTPLLRIIGSFPEDDLSAADSIIHTYARWLGDTIIMPTYPTLPFSEESAAHEDTHDSCVIYGCHCSSSWQAPSRRSNAAQVKPSGECPFADLYIHCGGADSAYRDREECAREIFGIFILTLAHI
jgi:hypothetical protein